MSHAHASSARIAPHNEHLSRQAVLLEPRHLEIREIATPSPGPGEILLRVECALSCGTDLKTFSRGHPLFPLPAPIGHEFAGTVAGVGKGVTKFRVGDAVMAAPTAPCGACFYCSRGQENLCPDAIGRMILGSYADYLIIGAHVVGRNAFLKPPDLPLEEAALLEPLSCVVHAHEIARPEPFESVLIIGPGAFGLLHTMVLKAAGVREVSVAGRSTDRLEWAGRLGADHVFDVRKTDVAAAIAALNGGLGPDLVIECTGQVEGWADAFARVRRGGRVVFFGGCPTNTALAVDTRRMHYDNLTLLAPFHYRPRDVRVARDRLCDRRLGAGRIINARRSLAELDEVFALLERGAALKCAVLP